MAIAYGEESERDFTEDLTLNEGILVSQAKMDLMRAFAWEQSEGKTNFWMLLGKQNYDDTVELRIEEIKNKRYLTLKPKNEQDCYKWPYGHVIDLQTGQIVEKKDLISELPLNESVNVNEADLMLKFIFGKEIYQYLGKLDESTAVSFSWSGDNDNKFFVISGMSLDMAPFTYYISMQSADVFEGEEGLIE
jgi:hypothetical protein